MLVFLCLLFIALNVLPSYAQENTSPAIFLSDTSAAVAKQPQKLRQEFPTKIHAIGFGISTTDGDATTGQQSIMLSAFYAYSWLSILDIETSLQQMSMSKSRTAFGNFFAISSALTHDINVMVRPFTWATNFRVGIGSSARWQRSLVTASQSTFDFMTMQYVSRQVAVPQNTFAVGATLKLEYLLPVSQVFDLSVRAQGHIYAPSVIGTNNHANGIGGAASVGLFFLIHP
jgi:hypothetical protein